ncbi:MFS transporter [Pseudobutyrivibrio sp.]
MDKKHSYKDVFSQTEYVKIMFAALINRFGDSIDAIATTWIVYQITGSAAWSALIFGINNLPTVVVTPLAGPWVEGRNKKRIMIVTDIIRAIVVATVASLFLVDLLQPWMLLISTIIISTVEAFRTPASTALTPMVLDDELYEFGMSLNSSLSQVVQLIGLGCAAGIIALVGISGALYIDMATFIMSAVIILFVNSHEVKKEKVVFKFSEYTKDFIDGVKYVSKEAVIVFFLLYTVCLNAVLVPVNGLQAPMAEQLLHSGVELLSIFSITLTVGMLLGSFVYPFIAQKITPKILYWGEMVAIFAFYVGIVVAEPLYSNKIFTYVIVSVLSVLLGMGISIGSSMISVIFMRKVNKEFIARTASIATSVSVMAMPVVSFIVSGIVSFVSVQTVFIVSGIATVVANVALSKFLYLLDDKNEGESEQITESIRAEEDTLSQEATEA